MVAAPCQQSGRQQNTIMLVTNSSELSQETSSSEMLLVRVEHELYALASVHVREVARYRQVTPVPGAPRMLPGVISQRGIIVPVVDLRLILGLALADVTRATRLVLASHEQVDLALLVDGVIDLIDLPTARVEPPPAALDPAQARLLKGIIQYDGQPIALLDLASLIALLRETTN
jgi:purine-binding chemotaxis protein CheW